MSGRHLAGALALAARPRHRGIALFGERDESRGEPLIHHVEHRSNGWERVKCSQGIFTRRTDELELYRVRDSAVMEPFWFRLVGKGNVVLTTTDTTTPTFVIECVPNVTDLRERVRTAIEACRDRKRARVAELGGVVADGDLSETQ